MRAAALFASASVALGAFAQGINSQTAPVIGILTVPLDSSVEPCITSTAQRAAYGDEASCFTSFYAKFVESAGGRPAVIPFNANTTILDALFESVNGILFTGGGADLFLNQTYVQTASYLFEKVVASASGPNPVALHGTCMGFQTLAIVAARNDSVLCRNCYNSENISWPLNLTAEGAKSPIFTEAPSSVVETFTKENSTLNLHHDGVPPAVYEENPRLANLLTMVSTNVDRVGTPFVSMWQGKNGLPITGTQFHPERQYLEYKPGIGANQ